MKRLYKKIGIVVGVIAAIGIITAILVYNGIIWPVYPSLLGYEVKGIDVARYQGDIDWKTISEQDVRFAFMKASEGSSYKDPKFEQNIAGAKENEIATGAYHFFSSESAGKAQAEHFMATASLRNLDLPPVLDFEIAPENRNDKDRIVAEVKDFLAVIELYYGVKPIIYTTDESYKAYLSEGFDEYPLWFRDMLKEPHVSKQEWLFWQYCNRGRLDGIDKQQKYTDLNVFNGNQQEFEDYLLEIKSQMEVTFERKADTPITSVFFETKV